MTTESRSAFVLKEFRVKTARNYTLDDDTSRTVEINTQLDEQSAIALANKVLAANEDPVVFEVVVEGVLLFDAFANGMPSYVPDFPKFKTDGRQMKVVAFDSDLDANLTTIRIRG